MSVNIETLSAITVAVPGTAQSLSATAIPVMSVTVQAGTANAGAVYVGDSNVSATRGITLDPGEKWSFKSDRRSHANGEMILSGFYVDAAQANDTLNVSYSNLYRIYNPALPTNLAESEMSSGTQQLYQYRVTVGGSVWKPRYVFAEMVSGNNYNKTSINHSAINADSFNYLYQSRLDWDSLNSQYIQLVSDGTSVKIMKISTAGVISEQAVTPGGITWDINSTDFDDLRFIVTNKGGDSYVVFSADRTATTGNDVHSIKISDGTIAGSQVGLSTGAGEGGGDDDVVDSFSLMANGDVQAFITETAKADFVWYLIDPTDCSVVRTHSAGAFVVSFCKIMSLDFTSLASDLYVYCTIGVGNELIGIGTHDMSSSPSSVIDTELDYFPLLETHPLVFEKISSTELLVIFQLDAGGVRANIISVAANGALTLDSTADYAIGTVVNGKIKSGRVNTAGGYSISTDLAGRTEPAIIDNSTGLILGNLLKSPNFFQ